MCCELLDSPSPSLSRGGWPTAGRGWLHDGFRPGSPLPALLHFGGGTSLRVHGVARAIALWNGCPDPSGSGSHAPVTLLWSTSSDHLHSRTCGSIRISLPLRCRSKTLGRLSAGRTTINSFLLFSKNGFTARKTRNRRSTSTSHGEVSRQTNSSSEKK